MARIKTDIAGLDEVLHGGIPGYATVLITGTPGTGKTILCQNIIFNVQQEYRPAMADKYKYTDYLWGLTDFFWQQGTAVFMTCEISGLFDDDVVTKHGFSYVADNNLMFKYLEADFKVHRLVGVLKMRGSGHRTEMREFIVDEKGPTVVDRPVV